MSGVFRFDISVNIWNWIRISVDFGVGAALSVCIGYGDRFGKIVLFRIDEVRILFLELSMLCIGLG
jgi:hypothetical protein